MDRKKYYKYICIILCSLRVFLFSVDAVDKFDNLGEVYVKNPDYITELENEFYIISLGSSCSILITLNELGLRKSSYPYDWCTVPFSGLYQSLAKDFSLYLDSEYFKIISPLWTE